MIDSFHIKEGQFESKIDLLQSIIDALKEGKKIVVVQSWSDDDFEPFCEIYFEKYAPEIEILIVRDSGYPDDWLVTRKVQSPNLEEEARKKSLLPHIIKDDLFTERVIETIICTEISGGTDYIENMPRKLTLQRSRENQSDIEQDYFSRDAILKLVSHLMDKGIWEIYRKNHNWTNKKILDSFLK